MLSQSESSPMARSEAVKVLASAHRERDPGTALVRWYQGGPADQIRLLEMSRDVSWTGEVIVVRFKSTDAIPYSTAIALVSEEELQEIDSGVLPLPDGWTDPIDV